MLADSFFFIGLINWETGLVPAVGVGSAAAALLMIHQSAKRLGAGSLAPCTSIAIDAEESPDQSTVEPPRPAMRGECRPIPALLCNAEATSEPADSWVIHRSMNGLSLSVATAVDHGAVLSVRPAVAPATAPWVQVKVEACHPLSSGWRLVCRFVKPPSWGSVHPFYEQSDYPKLANTVERSFIPSAWRI